MSGGRLLIGNCNWKAIVALFSEKNIFLEIVKLMERSSFSKSDFQRIVQSNRSHPTIQSKMSFQLTFFHSDDAKEINR